MIKASKTTVAILSLVALWGYRIIWKIFKIIVFLAILWGGIRDLTGTTLPVLGNIIDWSKTVTPNFIGSIFFTWLAENWMVLAILSIFLSSISNSWVLKDISKTNKYNEIFIGMMIHYLGVEPETPSLKKSRDTGLWSVINEGLTYGIAARIFGMDMGSDDRLNANAIRHGKEVHLSDDIKEGASIEVEKENS